MLVVVEGAMGAGKTALASALGRHSGWPVYRAFRAHGDGHDIGSDHRVKLLTAIGLPVNSWQEDLFIADIAAVTRPSLILDRSLPSALAWNASAFTAREAHVALDLWAERIVAARAVLVLVEASEELRRSRTSRWLGGEAEAISRNIHRAASIVGLPVLAIDTGKVTLDQATIQVVNAIRRCLA